MELDLDTFLTAVYCVVDDLYRAEFAPSKPVRRGHKPELSDSEVLTLTALAQWQRGRSERKVVAYAAAHWRAYFPRLLSQSQFNRRARDLCGVLCALGPRVAARVAALAGAPAYEALDGVPVPLMRRCRGDRHRLFAAEASVGRGGSDKDWYDGVELVAAVSPAGAVTGFVLVPAATEERWGAEALLRWRAAPAAPAPTAAELAPVLGPAHRRRGQRTGPTGPIAPRLGAGAPAAGPYLADRGLRGAAWGQHWRAAYGAAVLTPASAAPADPAPRRTARWARGLRQVVESAFQVLTDVLGLKFPRARSPWGLLARIGAKVAAYNLALLVNHACARPAFSLFDPLS
jgi:hypothetical protein